MCNTFVLLFWADDTRMCLYITHGFNYLRYTLHLPSTARLGFEKAMVGTRWATPRPDCMDRLRKHYSHLAEGWYLARKAAWALSGCMATNSADCYMLVNVWVWSKSRDCLLRLEVDMGSVLESDCQSLDRNGDMVC